MRVIDRSRLKEIHDAVCLTIMIAASLPPPKGAGCAWCPACYRLAILVNCQNVCPSFECRPLKRTVHSGSKVRLGVDSSWSPLLRSCILRACMNAPRLNPWGPLTGARTMVTYFGYRANLMLPAPCRWQSCLQYRPHIFHIRHQPATPTRASLRGCTQPLCRTVGPFSDPCTPCAHALFSAF